MGLGFKSENNAPTGVLTTKYETDPLLSAGSLFLFDLGWSSYTPDNAATIDNMAKVKAAAILGVTEGDANLLGTFALQQVNNVGCKVEKTAKNAFHVIMSKTADITNQGAGINIPVSVRAYLNTDLGNKSIYTSMWRRASRLTDEPNMPFGGQFSTTSVYHWILKGTTVAPASADSRYLGSKTGGYTLNVPQFQSLGFKNNAANVPSAGIRAFTNGNYSVFSTSTINKSGSEMVYRIYMEDLTVSGRTWDQVRAIDEAMFTDAFAVGGRFYGDTYTTPDI